MCASTFFYFVWNSFIPNVYNLKHCWCYYFFIECQIFISLTAPSPLYLKYRVFPKSCWLAAIKYWKSSVFSFSRLSRDISEREDAIIWVRCSRHAWNVKGNLTATPQLYLDRHLRITHPHIHIQTLLTISLDLSIISIDPLEKPAKQFRFEFFFF